MIYLFLGDDLSAKDAKITEIKNNFFKDCPEALNFDFDNLDAKGLEEDVLKQAFLTLPAIATRRLIILHQIHKLKALDIQVLIKYCQAPSKHCDMILESTEKTLKGDLKDLPLWTRGMVFNLPESPSVFDMTRLITAQRSGDALKMLDGFYRENIHPLQIMGALVWYWGREGKACSRERFQKGLAALEEADLNIKRSRLNPQYAVEKLVVELGLLLRR